MKILNEKDTRDLTIVTNKTYGEVVEKVEQVLAKAERPATITPISIYQPDKVKHISLHLEFDQRVDDALMAELEKLQ